MKITINQISLIAPTIALISCLLWVGLVVQISNKASNSLSNSIINSLCEKNTHNEYDKKDTNDTNYFVEIDKIKGFAINYNDIWCEVELTSSHHNMKGDLIINPKEIKFFNLKNIKFGAVAEVSKNEINAALLRHSSASNKVL